MRGYEWGRDDNCDTVCSSGREGGGGKMGKAG